MVGIPRDRVGAGYAGMWLVLYREWKWVLLGLHFAGGAGYTVYAKPKRSSELLTPQWVLYALTHCDFLFGVLLGVVAIVVVVLVHLCCYHLA